MSEPRAATRMGVTWAGGDWLSAVGSRPGPATTARPVAEPQLWQACAGHQVQLPRVGSHVIYFPQGHAETSPGLRLGPFHTMVPATIPARVLSVTHLADPATDEVYASITLKPEPPPPHPADIPDHCSSSSSSPPSSPTLTHPLSSSSSDRLLLNNNINASSFAKTLTQSDANNGGGFSIPRYCAETIFPRLDYSTDPPVQIVHAKDIHGTVWKFRHIYRGTPRRHLLTTGWSNFVNTKKLVAGDAIVFLRSPTGELCVGVRRSSKAVNAPRETAAGNPPITRPLAWDHINKPYHCPGARRAGTAPPRPSRGVAADSINCTIALALSGQAFEITYYPRASIYEFCVALHSVRASLQHNWGPGMRFKMAVETEDASRVSWFMGTVSRVQDEDPVRWPNSPWKILKVTWDEPDLVQGISRVCPWQVELVPPQQLPPFSFPKKKVRLSQPLPELRVDMSPQHINSSWYGFVDSVIPAGMQGARHERNYDGFSVITQSPTLHPTISVFLNSCTPYEKHVIAAGHLCLSKNSVRHVQGGSHARFSKPESAPRDIASIVTLKDSSQSPSEHDRDGLLCSKSSSFLLFGKRIDTSLSVNNLPVKSSEVSSVCNSPQSVKHDACPDGNRSEVYGSVQVFFPTPEENEKLNHCKVFSHNNNVERTIDLSSFESYEEVYKGLEKMFGAKDGEFKERVAYRDAMGFSRPMGAEPYGDFARTVRGLKVLVEYK